MRRLNLIGQRFGRWTVQSMAPKRGRQVAWICHCDCGKTGIALTLDLRSGDSRSCGCLRRDILKTRSITHGLTHSAEYMAWCKIKERCSSPANKSYHSYGGRGITVCPEWEHNFQQFYADMGPRPSSQYSVDRINNDGPYAPGNCRWATRHQQMRNTTRNRWLTHPDGRRMIMADWIKALKCSKKAILYRLNHGWTEDRALTTPFRFQSHQ